MRHVPTLELVHRVTRAKACAQCYQRPAGSERWGPELTRPCEETCALFASLPALADIAEHPNPAAGSYERALEEAVCESCQYGRSAGEYCSEQIARTCPLSRYAGHVIGALEQLTIHGRALHLTPADAASHQAATVARRATRCAGLARTA